MKLVVWLPDYTGCTEGRMHYQGSKLWAGQHRATAWAGPGCPDPTSTRFQEVPPTRDDLSGIGVRHDQRHDKVFLGFRRIWEHIKLLILWLVVFRVNFCNFDEKWLKINDSVCTFLTLKCLRLRALQMLFGILCAFECQLHIHTLCRFQSLWQLFQRALIKVYNLNKAFFKTKPKTTSS